MYAYAYGIYVWRDYFLNEFSVYFRLCVSVIHDLCYKREGDFLFAMFDGGKNSEVPRILKRCFPHILSTEMSECDKASLYLKYAFLHAHK